VSALTITKRLAHAGHAPQRDPECSVRVIERWPGSLLFERCHLLTQSKERQREAHARFQNDPQHPGSRFKLVHTEADVYSVRVSRDFRALGVLEEDQIVWFWIGSHSDYEKLLKDL